MAKYPINLKSNRLLLRNMIPEDKDFMIKLWTDPDVTKHMGGPRDRDKLELDIIDNIEKPYQDEFDLWVLVDKSSGIPVGHCGLLKKTVEGHEETEVIYVISKEYWGKGFATEIAQLLINYAFKQKKIDNVIALIKPDNSASEKVAIKAGLKLEKEIIRFENIKMFLYRKKKET